MERAQADANAHAAAIVELDKWTGQMVSSLKSKQEIGFALIGSWNNAMRTSRLTPADIESRYALILKADSVVGRLDFNQLLYPNQRSHILARLKSFGYEGKAIEDWVASCGSARWRSELHSWQRCGGPSQLFRDAVEVLQEGRVPGSSNEQILARAFEIREFGGDWKHNALVKRIDSIVCKVFQEDPEWARELLLHDATVQAWSLRCDSKAKVGILPNLPLEVVDERLVLVYLKELGGAPYQEALKEAYTDARTLRKAALDAEPLTAICKDWSCWRILGAWSYIATNCGQRAYFLPLVRVLLKSLFDPSRRSELPEKVMKALHHFAPVIRGMPTVLRSAMTPIRG